jgi:hypothetical protein
MLSGLRGRTNTTTSSSRLEGSTKTAQFYDTFAPFSCHSSPNPRKQDEGRIHTPVIQLVRGIVK